MTPLIGLPQVANYVPFDPQSRGRMLSGLGSVKSSGLLPQ